MQPKVFETTSKKLEEFLFVHDIRFASSYRNIEGLTVWVYPRNETVDHVVQEYRAIVANRIRKGRL